MPWQEFCEPTSVLCDNCHVLITPKRIGYFNPETKQVKCQKCFEEKK